MEPDYNLIGTGIDLRQVDPISQKRLLAFINFWLSQTVRFLNDVASQFETKLLEVDNRLRRLEASMTLLEAKLASIPGLDTDNVAVRSTSQQKQETIEAPVTSADKQVTTAAIPVEERTTENKSQVDTAAKPEEAAVEVAEDVTKDPRYAKYFKMLQLGVPEQAVKQKMDLEGVDSSILSQTAGSRSKPSVKSAATKTKKSIEKAESSDSFGDSEESSFSD